jgi:hypothetical protein
MKYNMILFVLEIFDYIQIKTLFFLFLILPKKNTHIHTHSVFHYIFFSCTHIYMLPITKIQNKTNNTSHK